MLQEKDFWTKIFRILVVYTRAQCTLLLCRSVCIFRMENNEGTHGFSSYFFSPSPYIVLFLLAYVSFYFFRLPFSRSLHPNPPLLSTGSLEVQRHCRTATEHAWTCASRALSSIKLNWRMGRSCSGLRLWRRRPHTSFLIYTFSPLSIPVISTTLKDVLLKKILKNKILIKIK